MASRANVSDPVGRSRPVRSTSPARVAGRRWWLVLPLVLATLLAARAVLDVDSEYDTWGYHLPFAARLSGLAGASVFTFEDLKEARFAGFPLLVERLQGALWRATGRVQSANLPALAALLGFWVFLERRLAVPYWLSVPALLAVPLVQIHATSGYVDLPVGVAVAVAALSTLRLWERNEATPIGDLLFIAGGIALATGSKHLAVPISGALWLAATTVVVSRRAFGLSRRRLLLTGIAVTPLLFAPQVGDLVRFGNPVYPVELRVAGRALPHAEAREVSDLVSPWWRPWPRPVRFALSALEVGAYDAQRPLPWVIDMGSVAKGARSDRIGGYFVPNVLLHLGILTWVARGVPGRRALAVLVGLTLAAAVQPQAQQMRFSLYWILALVALSSHLAVRKSREGGSRAPMRVLTAGCWTSLACVLALTRGYFLLPHGYDLETHLRLRVEPRLLRSIAASPATCLLGAQPNTFLYSSLFHPGATYRLKAAYSTEECGGLRALDARE